MIVGGHLVRQVNLLDSSNVHRVSRINTVAEGWDKVIDSIYNS